MNVKPILNRFLHNVTPSMHKVRRKAVSACLLSLMHGGAASVTSIGRNIDSPAKEKHRIKRADRLCSNTRLFNELEPIYASICSYWLSSITRPIILIDWSDLDGSKRNFLIRAAQVLDGRSITLYQEVHTVDTKEKPATHTIFLTKLKALLSDNCKPIIVSDAGFKVPWFKLVLALGWDYVGRSRKPNYYQAKGADWQSIDTLYKTASSKPKSFTGLLTMKNQFPTNFVLYKQRYKGREQLNKQGKKSRIKTSLHHAKGAKDPWLLVTSLAGYSKLANKVVKIYQYRMQIEEGFRDMKGEHYGLGFNLSKSKNSQRISILILLTTLASMLLLIIGNALVASGLSRRYQANTIKCRRVLSFQFVALRAVADKTLELSKYYWQEAIIKMKLTMLEAAHEI